MAHSPFYFTPENKINFLVGGSITNPVKFLNPPSQVFDKDITQDQRMGVAKLPLIELEPETPKEYEFKIASIPGHAKS